MASNLSRIVDAPDDPLDLFNDWFAEAEMYSTVSRAFCLSTVDRNGKAHGRNLMLRSIKRNNFQIMTDKRGAKFDQIMFNSNVAMTFLWMYKKGDEEVWRQVRIEGTAVQLDDNETSDLYEMEPLYCKIRSYLCHQDQKCDWEEHKKNHDKLLEEVEKGNKSLPMPDHVVGFEIQADNMDFYHGIGGQIADRIKYEKNGGTKWNNYHVQA